MRSEPLARLTVVPQGPGSLTSLHKGPSCSPAPRNRQHHMKKVQQVRTAQVKGAQCWKDSWKASMPPSRPGAVTAPALPVLTRSKGSFRVDSCLCGFTLSFSFTEHMLPRPCHVPGFISEDHPPEWGWAASGQLKAVEKADRGPLGGGSCAPRMPSDSRCSVSSPWAPARWPTCRFGTCQPRKSHHLIPKNESLSINMHTLLGLFV